MNHQTAPIQLREKVAIPLIMQPALLETLLDTQEIVEAAILSTCNRTELYCEAKKGEALLPLLAHHTHIPLETLSSHWYVHQEQKGIQHALRVASGLDSMMLGEPQIFGQFKEAYKQACESGSVKSSLKMIFPFVFKVAKRIRHESGINQHSLSIAKAAAESILNTFTSPNTLTVFIIGSGEIAQLVTKYLFDAGVTRFLVTNRTRENAAPLVDTYQAQFVPVHEMPHALAHADIIITATACPIPFITRDMVKSALIQRAEKPLYFLDLALPRNIEANVATLPHLTLCNLDDLKATCDENLNLRQSAALHAEQLIEKEVAQFIQWTTAQQAKKLITHYRAHMRHVAESELSNALRALKSGEAEEKIIQHLSHRLYKKLTHLPSITLRKAAMEGRHDLLDLAETLLPPYETNH